LISTPPSIVVRPASESDYPSVARIQGECPEAAQWPVGDYSAFNVVLALVDSQPAGFCAWRQVSHSEAELLNLGVAPEFRRKGVASALLDALGNLVERGAIFLEVAENNSAAFALYSSRGWESVGKRPGYYDHGRVNGVVMKKRSW
jgi:ribosomal-protein-alanine N-acetyltransferase